jgi:tRNA pseudouridine55 synthase
MARPKADPDLNGLLVVDKPGLDETLPAARLLTSHDVVQRVRRWSGRRRIGHTGTLDPFASGVLVLCLGQATRLVEYYQGHAKHYDAQVRLGIATDTYDATGTVIAQETPPQLDEATIEAALATLRGPQMQTPPAYSALKQDGEALYAKARRGEMVTPPARPVTIYALTLTAWSPPDTLHLHVHCSAGTYVRSLAHDLGRVLGTQAHLARLRRTAAGGFDLRAAQPLEAVEQAAAAGRFADLLLPVGAGLDLPILTVDATTALRLGQGQVVELAAARLAGPVLAQDDAGRCLGIIRAVGGERYGLWKADKWLTPSAAPSL